MNRNKANGDNKKMDGWRLSQTLVSGSITEVDNKKPRPAIKLKLSVKPLINPQPFS